MTLTLPNPNSPTNGDAGNADPIRANFQAITQAIQLFDGSQIQAATIAEAALASGINPRLRDSEIIANFVATGLLWSAVSGLNGTMSAGTVYVNGYRQPVSSIASKAFTINQDTYVDIDYLGNVAYVPVANGATSGMVLTASSVRVAKVVTNGSAITSVVTSGLDPLNNVIRSTAPITASKLDAMTFRSPVDANGWNLTTTAAGKAVYTKTGTATGLSLATGISFTNGTLTAMPVGLTATNLYSTSYIMTESLVVDGSSRHVIPHTIFDTGAGTNIGYGLVNVFTGGTWTGSLRWSYRIEQA